MAAMQVLLGCRNIVSHLKTRLIDSLEFDKLENALGGSYDNVSNGIAIKIVFPIYLLHRPLHILM